MPEKFDPAKKDVLLSSSRYDILDPQRVFSQLPLRPYQSVADVGCGPGFFTIPLAKFLFDGKVYALDIQQEMLDALKERLAAARLGNVEVILATEKKLPLEKVALDGALVAFALHETSSKQALLKEVLSHLNIGGWVAILEWHKKETGEGPSLESRLTPEEVRELAEKAGFTFVIQKDLNEKHYMVLLKKGKKGS